MKTLKAVTASIVIACAAVPAWAGSSHNQDLALCKSELKAIYGQDTRIKLKSIRNGRPAQLRIQAIPSEGDSTLVKCWNDGNGGVNLEDNDGVALGSPAHPWLRTTRSISSAIW